VFCDQLVATAEVAGEIPADPVGAGHQQIDEVVDHDRDLRSINRLKPDWPIRLDSHDRSRYRVRAASVVGALRDRKEAELDVIDHSMPSLLQRGTGETLLQAEPCDLGAT
jgi:hypothetical protein